ncbi:MAG: spermidine synthase, partial [Frankiales bacterium]|nr:spermidine synthase [Frankiales bacterium]
MRFTELEWAETPIGEISLRRRLDPQLKTDVYEVKLGDEYLMSSTFTFAEEELARLGLAELSGSDLDVVVGGLGLGCTAVAALEDPR